MTSRESITMHPHHQDKATLLERLIFNNRPVVIALCVLVSIFLFWQATQIRPSTSFEKMIPLQHPFIEQMMEHRNDLANLGNTVRISVEAVNGDIFDKDYMETLRQVHDEVFYIPGVDRAGLKSLWSPSVRWSEVTEEGFSGGEVIPNTYNGSQDSLDTLRDNVLKSGQVGRLVGNNFKSSIVDVPLLESYPDPQDPGKQVKLDYQQFSHLLEEKIRDKFQAQNPNVKVHIVGFAKKVGDLIDGLVMVAMFFGVALVITWVLLYWFTWCIRSTIAVLITTLVAVVWQLGLMHAVGFGLDPYSMLVPFLIFAIGISHGVQKINGIALQSSDADNALTAARRTFRQLFLPGMIAILADAVGFITLLIIDIGVIRELAIGASIGVAVMCLITFRSFAATLCIVLPLVLTSVLGNALMAYMGIGVKVATLPVVALGVGIGVDYGIYIYSRLESFLRAGLPLQEAYYQTLRSTGKAVLFTGLCLAIGVCTWIFSAIKFQADMGLMLTFMLLWNMFGALWLLPALARFLIKPEKMVGKEGGSIFAH